MKKNVLLCMIVFNIFLITGFSGYISHSVKKGESLYSISQAYSIPVSEIMGSNKLHSNKITVGQLLQIPLSRDYIVRKNDSLGVIANKTGVSVKLIKSSNHLSSDKLFAGQILLIPGRPIIDENFKVRKKDTLTSLSVLFDTPVSEIKRINKLKSDKIVVGETLLFKKGKASAVTILEEQKPQEPTLKENQESSKNIHIVEKNDSLWKISQKYKVSVAEIQRVNNLKNEKIIRGEKLTIPNNTIDSPSHIPSDVKMAGYNLLQSNSFKHETGIYYNKKPYKKAQPSKTYTEMKSNDPRKSWEEATLLLKQYDAAIGKEAKISNALKGYTFVIDPGHGGRDPGFLTSSKDGNGKTLYLVEDEYAYDTALRLYRFLKLNGAKVFLTIISPNHTVRNQSDPGFTFVHETNEVFNDKKYNRTKIDSDFPDGNSPSLYKRQALARNFFYGTPADKRILISIHYDNYKALPQGLYAIYDGENSSKTEISKKFADRVIKKSGGHAGQQRLAVLRNNGAYASLLFEVRNAHYKAESWKIRDSKERQRDAENIGRGLISAVGI